MNKPKREPIEWETYHTKQNDEITVLKYVREKEYVTYYKLGNTYTTKLQAFKQKIRKEDM